MPARLNKRHQQFVRDKIRASQLLACLHRHATGESWMHPARVYAAERLLALAGIKAVRNWTEAEAVHQAIPSPEKATWVYLAWAEGTDRYKIGYADHPASRMKELQTGCPFPVVLLAALDGDRKTEVWLHQRFAKSRICGEWFRLTPQAVAFLQSLSYEKAVPVTTGAQQVRDEVQAG